MTNTTLTQTLAALVTAREEHREDVDALARGRQWLSDAQARCSVLNEEASASVGTQAELLAERIRSGDTSPVPAVVTPAQVAAQQNAQANAQAAQRMVAILEADETDSRAKLNSAQRAYQVAREARMNERMIAVATKLRTYVEEANQCRAVLRVYGFDITGPLPPQVRAAMDLQLVHDDDLHGGPIVHDINSPISGRNLNSKAGAQLGELWAAIDAEAAQPTQERAA